MKLRLRAGPCWILGKVKRPVHRFVFPSELGALFPPSAHGSIERIVSVSRITVSGLHGLVHKEKPVPLRNLKPLV